MPLVSHTELPTFQRLVGEGVEVLTPARAKNQDIRELHIGLLNMMPDAALQATERQFMRLVGACNRIAQFHVHPFTVRGIVREGAAKAYMDTYYASFEEIAEAGLDALIITGANPLEDDITKETFWDGMREAMDWARENVCSTLMSCLASHAAFKLYYGMERVGQAEKIWGVYPHQVSDRSHPMVSTVNTRFPAPHSRWNDVTSQTMRAAGLRVLVENDDVGCFLASSGDGFRFVFFQGHPEYDQLSLPKEYKREVNRYIGGERSTYPEFPLNCFEGEVVGILQQYRESVLRALQKGATPPAYPDHEVDPRSDNVWTDTGKALFNNWLGLVYQVTNHDRRLPFMEGIDPDNPFGLAPL